MTKLLLILLSILLVLSGMIGFFLLSRASDFKRQSNNFEKLLTQDIAQNELVDELLDDGLRINSLRLLATHNSSHKQADPLRLFFIEMGESGEAVKLKYSHLPLYEQLDLGVRSFEMDLRYRAGRFENTHVPLVDDRSECPDAQLAFKEIRLWSDRNPAHIPLIILIEIKEDWMVLDPRLSPWDGETLITLDREINDILGDRLIRPENIKQNTDSVRDGIRKYGWPLLGENRGKVIVALMIDDNRSDLTTNAYLNNPDRVTFIMPSGPDSPEAAFIKRDDPMSTDISILVDQGFVIRTRADADLEFNDARKSAAIASGAQIVSTDFPLGYDSNPSDYQVAWEELF